MPFITPRLSTLMIFLVITFFSNAQPPIVYSDSLKQSLLVKGLYIENLNVTLPWHAKHSDLIKNARPTIEQGKQNFHWLVWDSVKIFNGLNIKLEVLSGHRYSTLTIVYGRIDSMDFDRAKIFLEKMSSVPSKTYNSKQHLFYVWTINNCLVRLGYAKGRYKAKTRNPFSLDFLPI